MKTPHFLPTIWVRQCCRRSSQPSSSNKRKREDNAEEDNLADNSLISKLSEVTSSLNKVANQIQSECSNNVIGNKRDLDLFTNAKEYHDAIKEDVTDEESIMAKYPTINYVNLHRQFSLFLID